MAARHKAKRKDQPYQLGDVPVNGGRDTAELVRDSDPDGRIVVHAIVVTQWPLDRYAKREQIDPDQYDAGERLRKDWHRSGMMPRMTADLARETGLGGRSEMTDEQVAAWQRYKRAIQTVGLILSPILVHVCCMGWPADDWAKSRGRPQGDGIAALRLALDALCVHYGSKRP